MEVNEKAPDFLGLDQNGKEVRRSDYPGKKIVLYFYPKDNTPGCTAEACSFRDNIVLLEDKGYQVIGVSVQGEESHQKFIDKFQLPFPLIADTDHKLVEEFGVWGEKNFCGRKHFGVIRTTFIIDADGTVEKVFGPKQIKTKIHAEQILQE